jgi:HlyD family secretion protein
MKRVIVAVVLLAVASGAAAAWYWPRRGLEAVMRLPGTVEVQEVRLGSRLGGRVAAVTVREGQVVEPGQELLRFDAAEPAARRDQARHRLEVARAAWDKASRGPLEEEITEARAESAAAAARLARTVAGYRDEVKRQARHELEADEAALRQAERDFDRISQPGAFSPSERDTVTAARDRALGRVRAAQAALDLVNRGSRTEDITEAEAERDRSAARHARLVRGTREEDKTAAYAAVGEAEAYLAEAETVLRETVVTAPERCVIEVVSVRAGDLVTGGQPVVRALRADDLWVKVFVPATDLGKVRLGRAVEVAVDSHPGRRFAGRVSQIAAASEFTPRNVQSVDERRHQVFAVRVRVADPDGVFKSGMAAEVFLDVSEGR